MTSRFYLMIGLTIVAVAVGGWRFALPASSDSQKQIVAGVTSLLDTVTRAEFTGAEATLDAQRTATGSYVGAPLTAPVGLVRADAVSYCIQVVQGTVAHYLTGPDGTPRPGVC